MTTMSTLSQALSIALSGLQTTSSLIGLASNNISNANTPGYTAKSVSISEADTGSDFGGATIGSYSRASNQALTDNYNTSTSAASYASTQNSYMTQVQNILNSSASDPTLTNDIAQFSAAWSQYAAAPENTIQQENVISTGQTLAADIQSVVAQTGALQTQVQNTTTAAMTSFNSDLQQLASINTQIQQATTSGSQTVDLQDQRDQLVNQIAAYTNVNVQQRANGQIALYTPSGQLLVDSGTAIQFSYNSTSDTISDSNGSDVTTGLTGGSLQAQIQFLDTSASGAASTTPGVGVIAKLQAQMSTLVGAFTSNTSSFATAYSAAATASTAAGAEQAGDTVDTNFFSVNNTTGQSYPANGGTPDASTIEVNPDLVDGASELPQINTSSTLGVVAIANSFNNTANYTASGLNAPSATYAGLGTAILSNFQQAASIINNQSTSMTSQQNYYQQTLTNDTGVNIDTELTNLIAYQNSYAANAHVISTISQMMSDLLTTIQ